MIDGDEFVPVMEKFYDESIKKFNAMTAKYDNLSTDINKLAISLGEKKSTWEEFYAFWREFMEEFDKNLDNLVKMQKEEAKAKRKAAGGKKGKKPNKKAKSVRKKPGGKDKGDKPKKAGKKKLGKAKAVNALDEGIDSEEDRELQELKRLQAEDPSVLDAKLQKVFKGIDKDGSGLLDFDEFKVAAKKFDMGNPEDAEDVKAAFDKVDVDGSGTLDFEEFKTAIITALSDQHKIAGVRGKMNKMFKAGCEVTLHSAGNAPAKTWIKVIDTMIKHTEPDKKESEDDYKTVDINKMKDVVDNKTTDAFKDSDADEKCCFSVLHEDGTLDLQVESEEMRDKWVLCLRKLGKYYKKQAAAG